MPYLARKAALGIKKESTQGTAVALTATDFALAYDISVDPQVEMNPQNYVSTSLSHFHELPGKKYYELAFTLPLRGSGTAGTELAPLGAALEASGFLVTVNSGTSCVYNRTSATVSNFYGPGKSSTVKFYHDGILHVAAGCMFDLDFDIEAGKPVGLKFKGRGTYAAVTDAAFPTVTPNVTIDPPVVKSASFAVQSYSAIISKMSVSINNNIAMRDDVNSANSILGFVVTDPDIKGSIDPERGLVADHDWWGKMMAATRGAITVAVGATAGNIATITGPKVQYMGSKAANRNGIATVDVPLKFCRDSGDDEIVITLT